MRCHPSQRSDVGKDANKKPSRRKAEAHSPTTGQDAGRGGHWRQRRPERSRNPLCVGPQPSIEFDLHDFLDSWRSMARPYSSSWRRVPSGRSPSHLDLLWPFPTARTLDRVARPSGSVAVIFLLPGATETRISYQRMFTRVEAGIARVPGERFLTCSQRRSACRTSHRVDAHRCSVMRWRMGKTRTCSR